MQVSGKYIRYTLYVEGVRIPISSFAVKSMTNSGAHLRVDILPIPEGMNFLKGMLVQLFKQVNNQEPILKFYGMVVGKTYAKSFGQRSLSLDIMSMTSRWMNMRLVEFSRSAITAGNNLDKVTATVDEALNNRTDKSIPAGTSDIAALTAAQVNTGGIGKRRNSDNLSTASLLAGTSMFGVSQVSGNVASAVNNDIPPELKKSVLGEAIARSATKPTSLAKIFEIAVRNRKGDVVSATVDIIQAAYSTSTDYNIKEYSNCRMGRLLGVMPFMGMGGFIDLGFLDQGSKVTEEEQKLVNDTREASQTNDPAKLAELAARLKQFELSRGLASALSGVLKEVAQAAAASSLYSMVMQLMESVFYKMSVDPTKLNRSIYFHPNTIAYFPPRCNVIFSNMYDSITFNPNHWAEPTRSIIVFPAEAKHKEIAGKKVSTNVKINVCDMADPYLAAATDIINTVPTSTAEDTKQQLSEQVNKSVANLKTAVKILTDEESAVGVFANMHSNMNPFFARLSDADTAVVSDFIHALARYSVRMCSVNGELLDDLAVGMPIVIMDGPFTVHGVLEGVSYSVDQNGFIQSSLDIGFPKMIMTGDNLPTPPLWLDTKASLPEYIGEVYSLMFGCGSIYSTHYIAPYEGKGQLTDSDKLRACIKGLQDEYDKAVDKRIFVEKYRNRSAVTMTQLFTSHWDCTPEKASYGNDDKEVSDVITWSGGPFVPYNDIGNAPGLPPHEVDKQSIARYFLKAYYNKPALLAK